MRGRFLTKSNKSRISRDIFANKSALVLEWLLLKGINRPQFAMRDIAGDNQISLGLVHRVVDQLVDEGFLSVEGVRTAKAFSVKEPRRLLEAWRDRYSIVEKCEMATYSSAHLGREAILSRLSHSHKWQDAVLALHTAADALKFSHSNIQTTELYVRKENWRSIVQELDLVPQNRGYDVLLVNPYYKSMLAVDTGINNHGAHVIKFKSGKLFCAPPLLTYLDLYHYPIRGEEQAEAIAQRDPDFKRIMGFRRK